MSACEDCYSIQEEKLYMENTCIHLNILGKKAKKNPQKLRKINLKDVKNNSVQNNKNN